MQNSPRVKVEFEVKGRRFWLTITTLFLFKEIIQFVLNEHQRSKGYPERKPVDCLYTIRTLNTVLLHPTWTQLCLAYSVSLGNNHNKRCLASSEPD